MRPGIGIISLDVFLMFWPGLPRVVRMVGLLLYFSLDSIQLSLLVAPPRDIWGGWAARSRGNCRRVRYGRLAPIIGIATVVNFGENGPPAVGVPTDPYI